jgi:hypothetical protein
MTNVRPCVCCICAWCVVRGEWLLVKSIPRGWRAADMWCPLGGYLILVWSPSGWCVGLSLCIRICRLLGRCVGLLVCCCSSCFPSYQECGWSLGAPLRLAGSFLLPAWVGPCGLPLSAPGCIWLCVVSARLGRALVAEQSPQYRHQLPDGRADCPPA